MTITTFGDQKPEPDGECDRREDIQAKLFREHRRSPSRESELDVRRRPLPRHRRIVRDEERARTREDAGISPATTGPTEKTPRKPRKPREPREDAALRKTTGRKMRTGACA